MTIETYMKMIFITASPLLARNVSKLYHRVLNYLKSLLKEKERKKTQAQPSENNGSIPLPKEKNMEGCETPEDDFEIVDEEISEGMDEESKRKREEANSNMVSEAMEGFDMKILEEAEKEIEQMLEEININEDSSEVPNSFFKIKIDDFPLFLTLKEFIYLMDSLMPTSFFSRNIENIIRSGIKKNNGKKGFYRYKDANAGNRLLDSVLFREEMNNQYTVEISSDEDEEGERVVKGAPEDHGTNFALSDARGPAALVTAEELVSEVDFEDFRDTFYPYCAQVLKYYQRGSEHRIPEVWQKIRNMDLQYASEHDKNVDRFELDMYKQYKKWKDNTGSYDLNDLYMHIHKSYEIDLVAGNLVDFLYLDEIQDIPVHLLNYLKRFGTKYFYFSGDNAQNITKGVTFNFQDLARTYNSYKKNKLDTEFHALTINYRSHQQILELGNNIIFLLKMLFPSMLEYLPPEQSHLKGPKPVLLPLGCKEFNLIDFMKSNMNLREQSDVTEMEDAKSITQKYRFSNSQVFITRDYKSKQSAMDKFPGCIALTILEAKGMEFEDVILYNYFTDSSNHKSLLDIGRHIEVKETRVPEMKGEELTADTTIFYKKATDEQGGYFRYEITYAGQRWYPHMDDPQAGIAAVGAADELKMLYVAITRAKKRVLVYDELHMEESKHSRSFFDKFWKSMKLAVAPSDIDDIQEFKEGGAIEKTRERKKWLKDGFEYIHRGHFNFAELCFLSGEFETGVKLSSLCSTALQLKKDYFLLQAVNSEEPEEQKTIENQRAEVKQKLITLGDEFLSRNWTNQAIQCFTIAGQLTTAAEVYESRGSFKNAADYFYELGMYQRALENYSKAADYFGMISCLEMEKDTGSLLALFNIIKGKVKKEDLPALMSLTKSRLRQEMRDFNAKLISDEDDLAVNKPKMSLDKLVEHMESIEPEVMEDKEPKSRFEELPMLSSKISEDDKQSQGFEAIDMDDMMSHKDSFEFVNSEIDELEKLSESFVGVSVEDQKIRTNPSLFEDFASAMDRQFSFRESEILTKVISRCHQFYDDLIKTKDHPILMEAEKVYEFDMLEIPESMLLEIVKFIENSGAYSLRLLIEKKMGTVNHWAALLCSYLYQITPVQISVANCTNSQNNHQKRKYLKWAISQNCNEIRRLATMSFLNILQRFNQKAIREKIQENTIESRVTTSSVVLLGYFRQLIHLLSPEEAYKVLSVFGEIQTLIMMKISRREVEVFDQEALLTDLIVAPGIRKLAIVYGYFEGHNDIIKSSLFYFAVHYLWNLKTYMADTFDQELEEIEKRDIYLTSALGIMRNLVSGNYKLGFEKIQELNISDIARANTLEAGFFAGVLVMCFFFNPQILDQKVIADPQFKQCQAQVKPYLNYYRSSMLFKTQQNNFIEGMLLTLRISLIPTGCSALSLYSLSGCIAHKTSLIFSAICDIYQSPQKSIPDQWTQMANIPMPAIYSADCGQEFFSVSVSYLFNVLDLLAQGHLQIMGKFMLCQMTKSRRRMLKM